MRNDRPKSRLVKSRTGRNHERGWRFGLCSGDGLEWPESPIGGSRWAGRRNQVSMFRGSEWPQETEFREMREATPIAIAIALPVLHACDKHQQANTTQANTHTYHSIIYSAGEFEWRRERYQATRTSGRQRLHVAALDVSRGQQDSQHLAARLARRIGFQKPRPRDSRGNWFTPPLPAGATKTKKSINALRNRESLGRVIWYPRGLSGQDRGIAYPTDRRCPPLSGGGSQLPP